MDNYVKLTCIFHVRVYSILEAVNLLTYKRGPIGFSLRLGWILLRPDTGYPALTGYCSKKLTICPKMFNAIPYYALGAQLTPPPLFWTFGQIFNYNTIRISPHVCMSVKMSISMSV